QLAEIQPDSPRTLIEDFARIERDEQRHGQLFELFAKTFDVDDHLAEGQTAEALASSIAAIGEEFLPRRMRPRSVVDYPLGIGGKVLALRGTKSTDKQELFDRLLRESDLLTAVDDRASRVGKRRDQLLVAIKPTFMLGYNHK